MPFVNQVYAADCRRSMIARTSSILSSVMRSTGRAPPRSRCGLNSQTRASPGGYTWPSWPANHSSRRSRVRLFGRGVDRPVCQRETVCGVVSRSCAISRPLMPPDSLMLSSFRATAVAMDPRVGQQDINIYIYIVANISVNVQEPRTVSPRLSASGQRWVRGYARAFRESIGSAFPISPYGVETAEGSTRRTGPGSIESSLRLPPKPDEERRSLISGARGGSHPVLQERAAAPCQEPLGPAIRCLIELGVLLPPPSRLATFLAASLCCSYIDATPKGGPG